MSELKMTGFIRWIENQGNLAETLQDPWPITKKPNNLLIAVAGGRHPTHAYWMQSALAPKVVSEVVELPASWDKLIYEAENDLGSLPE